MKTRIPFLMFGDLFFQTRMPDYLQRTIKGCRVFHNRTAWIIENQHRAPIFAWEANKTDEAEADYVMGAISRLLERMVSTIHHRDQRDIFDDEVSAEVRRYLDWRYVKRHEYEGGYGDSGVVYFEVKRTDNHWKDMRRAIMWARYFNFPQESERCQHEYDCCGNVYRNSYYITKGKRWLIVKYTWGRNV